MGADSVSSTLSSLSSCKPPPAQDDFDVFAQTRSGALAEPHTTTAAENPAAEGPPPTLDVQQPAAGGVSCSHDVLLAVWSVTGGVAIKRSTWYFSKRLPFCCFAFLGRFSSSPQFDLFWFLFRLTQRDLLLLFIGLSIL
ncbi:hypothetical protein XENORESO_006787 [Xenotaenia resolanae]|uniref:Uncharacterized protein n=1 Tax=Xenotaenia resolanae TaxID=208358 RepID=A0ABV0VXW9_9TELE